MPLDIQCGRYNTRTGRLDGVLYNTGGATGLVPGASWNASPLDIFPTGFPDLPDVDVIFANTDSIPVRVAITDSLTAPATDKGTWLIPAGGVLGPLTFDKNKKVFHKQGS